MLVDSDIQSQLDRAKELLRNLKDICNSELHAKDVSGQTKNLSQEVLLKVRHLLDQSLHKFYEKHYLPSLSAAERAFAKLYFPIVTKKENMKSVLGRAHMSDLEMRYPEFYKFLESVQPYNPEYLWLKLLADFSAEKHIRLTPQTKAVAKRVTVSRQGGSVSWGPGVTFGGGVSVMGVPIDPKTQLPVPNSVAETKVENWVSFLFAGTNVNVLWLCEKSVEGVGQIIRKIYEYL